MKKKMEKLVREQKDFLLTLETTTELMLWRLHNVGIPDEKNKLYLEEQLRKNGIFTEKLICSASIGITNESIRADQQRYQKKVKKWNSENK